MTATREPADPAAPAGAPDPTPPATMTAGQWVRLGLVAALLVWLTVATGVYGLVMVLGIVVMITLHELGHYVTAKRSGMKVTEFFLGFGPRIWSMRKGETEYGLKLVPAGAYVKIVGMHDIEDVDPADEPRTYRQQPFWQRFAVAVAGSTVHFVLALALIFTLLVGFGAPGGSVTNPDETAWRVGIVTEGSAAADGGLREGDDIIAVDGETIVDFDDLREAVIDRPGDDVVITYVRDDEEHEASVTLGQNPDIPSAGFLGVGHATPLEKLSPVAAVPATFREFGGISVESVKALGRFFTPSGIADFGQQVRDAGDDATVEPEETPTTRPAEGSGSGGSSSAAAAEESPPGENRLLSLLGVFRIGVDAGEGSGVAGLILLFALINIFVGLFNLLPLLPFDGGHVAIAVYEKVREWRRGDGRRYLADVGKLLPMTYAVVGVLALIFISTLYLDIVNPLAVN